MSNSARRDFLPPHQQQQQQQQHAVAEDRRSSQGSSSNTSSNNSSNGLHGSASSSNRLRHDRSEPQETPASMQIRTSPMGSHSAGTAIAMRGSASRRMMGQSSTMNSTEQRDILCGPVGSFAEDSPPRRSPPLHRSSPHRASPLTRRPTLSTAPKRAPPPPQHSQYQPPPSAAAVPPQPPPPPSTQSHVPPSHHAPPAQPQQQPQPQRHHSRHPYRSPYGYYPPVHPLPPPPAPHPPRTSPYAPPQYPPPPHYRYPPSAGYDAWYPPRPTAPPAPAYAPPAPPPPRPPSRGWGATFGTEDDDRPVALPPDDDALPPATPRGDVFRSLPNESPPIFSGSPRVDLGVGGSPLFADEEVSIGEFRLSTSEEDNDFLMEEFGVKDDASVSPRKRSAAKPAASPSMRKSPPGVQPRTIWQDKSEAADGESMRRITMGETQITTSLAGINTMMQRKSPVAASASKPQAPDSSRPFRPVPPVSDSSYNRDRPSHGARADAQWNDAAAKQQQRHPHPPVQQLHSHPPTSYPPSHHFYPSRPPPHSSSRYAHHYAPGARSAPQGHGDYRYKPDMVGTRKSLPAYVPHPHASRDDPSKKATPPTAYSSRGRAPQQSTSASRRMSPFEASAKSARPASGSHITPTGKENTVVVPSPQSKRKRAAPCKCKKSRCLKLYCECFAKRIFCSGCKCVDCHNLEEFRELRDRTVKMILSKKKNAFGSTEGGCRCQKSKCLKKYCECFSAGIVCCTDCKCIECQNIPGSQMLLDKRKQMKDKEGIEYTMEISKGLWERKRGASSYLPHKVPVVSTPALGLSPMMQAMPGSLISSQDTQAHQQAYYGRASQIGPPPMGAHIGYSPMDAIRTPGYRASGSAVGTNTKNAKLPSTDAPDGTVPGTNFVNVKRQAQEITPFGSSPRTPGIRLSFDLASCRKKCKTEEHFNVGEKLAPQPKTVILNIFSFLTNMDLYKASQVCKEWNALATDDELWKVA